MALPANEQCQPRSIASLDPLRRREAVQDDRVPGRPRVEGGEDLVDRLAAAVGVAGVDDDRQAEVDGDLDLGLEGAALLGGRGAFPVVVEAGLADRPHLLVPGEPCDPRRRLLVESGRLGRVMPDRGEHPLVALGPGDRLGVGLPSEADVQHPPHPRLERRRDQLGLRPLAEKQVGVGVDHRAGDSILGKSGAMRSILWPPGREPSSANAVESSPSAVSTSSLLRGR